MRHEMNTISVCLWRICIWEAMCLPAEYLRSHDAGEHVSVSLSHFNSLDFVVLHQVCHLMQVGLQLVFFMAQVVQLLAQVGNVGLEHDISVGAGDGLLLQEFPLGLQHFVLLLQEAHLETQESGNLRSRSCCSTVCFSVDMGAEQRSTLKM